MSAMFVTRTGHINHKNNGLFPANQTAKQQFTDNVESGFVRKTCKTILAGQKSIH